MKLFHLFAIGQPYILTQIAYLAALSYGGLAYAGDKTVLPSEPMSELSVMALGRGLDKNGARGTQCVLGNLEKQKLTPRIEFFLKRQELDAWRNRPTYIYGVRIITSGTHLVNPRLNTKWIEISHGNLKENCGTHFSAGEELGVMITKELHVEAYEESKPALEKFESLEQLEARVSAIKNVTGPIFQVSYVDSQDGFIANYNTIYGPMNLAKFVELFWATPSDEATAALSSSTGRTALVIQELPSH